MSRFSGASAALQTRTAFQVLGLGLCAALGTAFFANAALADATSVSIEADKTMLIKVAAKPGTVIVGNPAIADVSIIDSENVVLHGHGFGNTNIIILDNKGGQLANLDVTVNQSESNALTLYRGPTKYSMACAPVCDYVLQAGDNAEWFKAITEQQASKNTLATGSGSTEAKAPTAAQ